MGIRLDWEVESEDDWEEAGEDPAAALARRQRLRRIRNIIIIVGGVIAAIGLAVTLRLRAISERLQIQLETAVAAETLALRLGDRGAFLGLQADEGEWRRIQADVFDEYQELGSRLSVPGEILDMQIDGDHARVTLREVLDGTPYRVTWYYVHTERGWEHTSLPPDALGDLAEESTEHFTASFREGDRPAVEALLPRLEAWWDHACRLTGCDHPNAVQPEPIRVVVSLDPLARPGWSGNPADQLIVPSPSLHRVPEDPEMLDPELTTALTQAIAERWAQAITHRAARATGGSSTPRETSDLRWVEGELAAWLHDRLDPTAPPSTFFSPLEDEFGPEIMPAFTRAIQRDDRLVPVLQTLTGTSAIDLPVDWRDYIAFRLRAEAALLSRRQPTEAMLLYQDLNPGTQQVVVDPAIETEAEPDSIRVRSVQRVGDVLFAEVRYSRVPSASRRAGEMLVGFEPYRLDATGWVHTRFTLDMWGEERRESSEHFDLLYYDLDAESAEGLLDELERAYAHLSGVFNLAPEPEPRYLVLLTPLTPSEFFARGADNYPEGYDALIWVSSPYTTLRQPGVSPREEVHAAALWDVAGAVMLAGENSPIEPGGPFSLGFIAWALDDLGVDVRHLPLSEQGLLSMSQPESLLIRLLINRYGLEGTLQRAGGQIEAEGMNDWLQQWLDVAEADALRADWENCIAGRPTCSLRE